ncbi:MAG: DUF559 domain-containing protein, partial [Flammeovirgaceae bacterium]|nr:DUF559 domain-containing protein [Flammeovirgaceae bacterium]
PNLKAIAQDLRNNMTKAEVMLWKGIQNKQLGVDFDRQTPINEFIVDFFCKELRLAIEVDGSSHDHEKAIELDASRQKKLERFGITFLRFDARDVLQDVNRVLDEIREWVEMHNPPPAPPKEGSKEWVVSKEGNEEEVPPRSKGEDIPAISQPRRRRNVFEFKQFSIQQDRNSHKVGTDGVLLGAWARVDNAKTILDIGTGSGVIALMMAQRSLPDCRIDAVELGQKDAEQARENVLHSPWPDKVRIHHSSIQSFACPYQYDLIVSNPPFFIKSTLPPHEGRTKARHAETLSFDELIEKAKDLLAGDGKLNIILPPAEAEQFLQKSGACFFLSRQCDFRSRDHKPIERILMELSKKQGPVERSDLTLYDGQNEWSEAYKTLTRDFYLKI